jgi:hypothetical protein
MANAASSLPNALSGKMLTPAEVAERLGVTENALAIWRYYRRGPTFKKFGRSVRYEPEAVTAFEEANEQVCKPEIRNLRRR